MEIVIVALVAVAFWLIWRANKTNDTINTTVTEEVKVAEVNAQPIEVAPVAVTEVVAVKPKKAPAKKRTPNAAFMKALTPSPALAAVVGSTPLPRTAIVSKLWDYIKAQGLQDPADKRTIRADDKLRAVFGKDSVTMFEIAKIIGPHLIA